MINFKNIKTKRTLYTAIIIILIASLITAISPNVTTAQMADNSLGVPHYYGPYPNYATSQLPTVTTDPNTGSITSVSGGIRKFIDSLPLVGESGANNLGQYIPEAVADTTTYPGCDYYEIALVEFTQQMHTDIPATTLRGYVQLETPANYAISKHYPLTYPNGSAILKVDGSQAIAIDRPRYLGPQITAQKDMPTRVTFTNFLPTGMDGDLFLPVDTTVMGAGMGPIPMLNPDGSIMYNPDGTIMYQSYTQNRATVHLHGGNTPWISDGTVHQWITPAGEDTVYPKGVSVQYVPDMWFVNGNIIPDTIGQTTPPVPGASNDPGAGSLTFYYTNQQSARLLFYHDHSYGITRLNVYAGETAGYIIRDSTEQSLINQGIIPQNEIPLIIQDKTFVPDTTTPITNMYGTFASQLAFQDPTWDTARYGGTGNLWYPHVYMPMQNPGDPSGQNQFGRWQYSPWFWPPYTPTHGPVANPYYNPLDPNNPMEPKLIPGTPNPSMPGEAFMDTPVINGIAYPYLEVEPQTYRFRILNAADDRAWNLQFYVADNTTVTFDGRTDTEVKMVQASYNATYPAGWPTDGRDGGVPDPANIGPSFIQIGNEAGFLPSPTVLPTQPVDWNWNQGNFDFGTLLKYTLLLGAAERADVLVDFSQFAGKTLILYNDCPAPVPAIDPRQDYYTDNPDQTDSGGAPSTIAGYGPNTRTIMQIRVANTTPAQPYDIDALNKAFASTATTQGVFAASQNPIIVPEATYNSAYNQTFTNTYGTIYDNSLTFTPLNSATSVTIPLQNKAIHDEMGGAFEVEYGRMSVMMGVEQPKSTPYTQTTILYNYMDSPTELIKPSIVGTQIGTLDDGTQIWRITQNGVDTHPMHWHMFDVQLINRVGWDNLIRPPDANELGWKETIRVNPLQDTYIALRPIVPDLPFDLPDSIRPMDPTLPLGATIKTSTFIMDPTGQPITEINNEINFGWEYMWHCHMLAHEEMDAMRPMVLAVPPRAPSDLSVIGFGNRATLTWKDNSISETGFTVQRANDANFFTAITLATVGAGTNTYVDTTVNPRIAYYYRVQANDLVGDTTVYTGANGFPTLQANSGWSNTAVLNGPTPPNAPSDLRVTNVAANRISLAWTDNSFNELGFIIQVATDSAFTQNVRTFSVRAGATTFTDTGVTVNRHYYYRVLAYNAAGNSDWSNVVNPSTTAPTAPSNLVASNIARRSVTLSWTVNSNNQNGFTIQRATNPAFTANVRTFSVGADTNVYLNNALTPNTLYYYRVQAYNGIGSSAWSNVISVRTLP
jgi:FtsP/CotA-like multicopper oxidase with cupredoxin domain